jgi:hypothetical protein
MPPACPSLVVLCRQSFLIGPMRAHGLTSIFRRPETMTPAITTSLLKMAGLTSLLCCFAIAQQNANTPAAPPSLTSILEGMEKAQSEVRQQTPYQVIREYSLSGMKSSGADADVVAQVDFTPPTGKNYSIQKWSGSARGKQVVQRVLDHEMEASKDIQSRAALSRDNYDFTLMSDAVLDGRPCHVLGLKPKRKEKDLVSGLAWVDKSSFLILHLEGETAKTPSWWLKSVQIKLSFGDVSGMWLQTNMEAVSDVRLLGVHTLRSRMLDYRSSDISASIKPAPSRTPSRFQRLAH